VAGGWRLQPTGERMQRSAAGTSVSGTHAAAAAPATISNPADSSAPGGDGRSGGSGSGAWGGGGTPEEPAPPPLLHLFAHPAESNFSGVRYDPALAAAVRRPGDSAAALAVSPAEAAVGAAAATDGTTAGRSAAAAAVQRPARKDAAGPAAGDSSAEAAVHRPAEAAGGGPEGRWLVALDAAKACGTSPPDLSAGNVDFLVSVRPQICEHVHVKCLRNTGWLVALDAAKAWGTSPPHLSAGDVEFVVSLSSEELQHTCASSI